MTTKTEVKEKTKAFFKSKTVQSCLVIMLLSALSLAGFTDNNVYVQLIILIASGAGIYGRVVAEDKIKI